MNKAERRREIREIIDFLRSDLYERDRDYSEKNAQFHAGAPGAFTCEIKAIEVDHEHEMLWGSPLGWRVLIRIEEGGNGEKISLKIFDPPGELLKGPFAYDEANYGIGVNWLDDNLY